MGDVFHPSFNRTIVELKHVSYLTVLRLGFSFNRTIVELKRLLVNVIAVSKISFNRTIVELKPSNLISRRLVSHGL